MEGNTTPIQYPSVTVRQLVERQLADWQHLLTELQSSNAALADLAYCRAQIERLQTSLSQL